MRRIRRIWSRPPTAFLSVSTLEMPERGPSCFPAVLSASATALTRARGICGIEPIQAYFTRRAYPGPLFYGVAKFALALAPQVIRPFVYRARPTDPAWLLFATLVNPRGRPRSRSPTISHYFSGPDAIACPNISRLFIPPPAIRRPFPPSIIFALPPPKPATAKTPILAHGGIWPYFVP